MSLKDELASYAQIFDEASKDVTVAAAFVVMEGLVKARGKCTPGEKPGQLNCGGEGPGATEEDCKAAKELFKVPDDVIMLFESSGNMWSSNNWFGPEFNPNGMLITNSELKITTLFPIPGKGGAPGTGAIVTAIKDAADK